MCVGDATIIELDETDFYADRALYERTHALLSFADIGLAHEPAESHTVQYEVSTHDRAAKVMVLRTFTVDDDDMILVQVLSHAQPPIMGVTALVAPIGEALADAEERIAMNAFEASGF